MKLLTNQKPNLIHHRYLMNGQPRSQLPLTVDLVSRRICAQASS